MLLAETAKTPGPEIGVSASVPRKCPPDAGLDCFAAAAKTARQRNGNSLPHTLHTPYTWLSSPYPIHMALSFFPVLISKIGVSVSHKPLIPS
jgi:hypothetical protein